MEGDGQGATGCGHGIPIGRRHLGVEPPRKVERLEHEVVAVALRSQQKRGGRGAGDEVVLVGADEKGEGEREERGQREREREERGLEGVRAKIVVC